MSVRIGMYSRVMSSGCRMGWRIIGVFFIVL